MLSVEMQITVALAVAASEDGLSPNARAKAVLETLKTRFDVDVIAIVEERRKGLQS